MNIGDDIMKDKWDLNADKLIRKAGKYLKKIYGNKAILKNGNVRTYYLIKEIDKLDQINIGILSDKKDEFYGDKPFISPGWQKEKDEYDKEMHDLLWRVLTLKRVSHKKLREWDNPDELWYNNEYHEENYEKHEYE